MMGVVGTALSQTGKAIGISIYDKALSFNEYFNCNIGPGHP